MQTCSNCGASVREGAKFCTSCGTRLNDAAPATAANSWAAVESDATIVAPAVALADANDDSVSREPDPTTESTPQTASDGGFAWSWGSSTVATSDVASEDESIPESETEADVAPAPPVDQSKSGPEEGDDVESEEATDTFGTDEAVSGDDSSLTEDSVAADDGEDATLAAWWSDDENAPPDDSTEESVEAGSAAASDDVEVDAATRAEQLLDELKRIIPALARPRALEPGANAEGNTGLLSAANYLPEIDESDGAESFDDLRDSIEAARANPRDVDSMLKLAANADRLKALLDDRDQLAGKLVSIREKLKSQASGEAE